MKCDYYFSKETEVFTSKGLSETFYELEYFFAPDHGVVQADGSHRFSLDTQSVFSSSAFQKTWLISAGSRFSSYRFIFSRIFLEENFYLDDVLLKDTILQQIIDIRLPFYHRKVSNDELKLLRELDDMFSQKPTRLLQIIAAKAKVLDIFCKFFETDAQPTNTKGGDLSAALELIRQNVDETFPGLLSLAKASNVSIPTFKRKFKLMFLTTPERYFRQLQMDKAEVLLRTQRMTVREIAAYLGYVNPKNFTERFKELKGFLPSEIKK